MNERTRDIEEASRQNSRQEDFAAKEADDFEGRYGRLLEATGTKNDSELARWLGIRQQSIFQAKKRGRIPNDWIVEVGRKADVSTDWLLFGETRVPSESEDESGFLRDYGYIPVVSAELNAGGGSFVYPEDEQVSDRLPFRRAWLKRISQDPSKLVMMFVTGDSMTPRLSSGDACVIDTNRRRIHDGRVYALRLGEVIAIKRLELLVGDRVRVISDNKAEYPPYEVDLAEVNIIGELVWSAHEWRKNK